MKQLQILLPPVYLLLSLTLMGLLHYLLPVVILLSSPANYTGYVTMLCGLSIILYCVLMFRKATTPIIPFEKPTALISTGIYRYSRNPVYLGMLIILLGAALALGSLSPFVLIPVFFVIIQQGYVRHEERFLEKIFGEEYLRYKACVRRWL